MGLHLNYELRLPASTAADEVGRLLAALRARALELPFEQVARLAVAPRRRPKSPARPPRTAWLEFWAELIAEPFDDEVPRLTGDVSTARGFLVNPGEGCETATFGFLLRTDEAGVVREWFWRGFCKTQYASVVSNAHLVACHTSLVALLDHAIQLGVDVTVDDETHYWETRDESRLIAEVGAMNRLIAAFAGRLSDTLGPEHRVEASIFEHRRFEYLEMGEREEQSDDA